MAIKTFHLTNTFHRSSGGIRTFYLNLLQAANRRERYVRLLVPSSETAIEEVGRFGRIYHVRAPKVPFFDRRYRLILPHRFLNPFDRSIWPILRSEQPDLIEITDKFSLCYIGSLIRSGLIRVSHPGRPRPTVVAMSCERLDDNVEVFLSKGSFAKSVSRWYLGAVLSRQFDAFIANSSYTAAELSGTVQPSKRDHVHFLPRGVDVDCFHPRRRGSLRNDMLSSINGGPRSFVLLYVGRLSPEKNLSLLFDVIGRLAGDASAEYHLLLAGDGPLRQEFEQTARRIAPGRVHFWGHIDSREALADLYANCDAFVHPNPKEPFGIAPLEAIASGLPVVAPRSGGVLSYLDTDNSWLTNPTPRAFEAAVRDIAGNPGERRRRCENTLKAARARTWDRVTDAWFEIYDRLHGERLRRHHSPYPHRRDSVRRMVGST